MHTVVCCWVMSRNRIMTCGKRKLKLLVRMGQPNKRYLWSMIIVDLYENNSSKPPEKATFLLISSFHCNLKYIHFNRIVYRFNIIQFVIALRLFSIIFKILSYLKNFIAQLINLTIILPKVLSSTEFVDVLESYDSKINI